MASICLSLSKLLLKNFRKVGPPRFDEADVALARQLQSAVRADFGLNEGGGGRLDGAVLSFSGQGGHVRRDGG